MPFEFLSDDHLARYGQFDNGLARYAEVAQACNTDLTDIQPLG
ncbi:hypothetical protein [Thermus scotoductus]|nr:hypothetical protein [Thermus scotoductus]